MEDLEPNLEYELEQYSEQHHERVNFNKEARTKYLQFATSTEAQWKGNFRDLNASISRLCTLAMGGRINLQMVEEEILRLKKSWGTSSINETETWINEIISEKQKSQIDYFDWVQLKEVLKVCRNSKSLFQAGRLLFSTSRNEKKNKNDADRLSKYLGRFHLSWEKIRVPN